MTGGVDLQQFYETFFDEADELLADMEASLLELDVDQPDIDQLNSIFREAHSIKGGAATFGSFEYLANTTHLLENLLDALRRSELTLRKDMIDLFLETKDVLANQVAAYRRGKSPDADAYIHICASLEKLSLNLENTEISVSEGRLHQAVMAKSDQVNDTPSAQEVVPSQTAEVSALADLSAQTTLLRVHLTGLNDRETGALHNEMGLLGDIVHVEKEEGELTVWLHTTASAEDLEAVSCFIVNPEQVTVDDALPAGHSLLADQDAAAVPVAEAVGLADSAVSLAPAIVAVSGTGSHCRTEAMALPDSVSPQAQTIAPASAFTESLGNGGAAGRRPTKASESSSTLRVGVEKVDQIINLVGELVITQAMLAQTASLLDPVEHDRLLNGIEILERNARDLQEAVMSIRMMPMDYVFRRFPRVVRESASRLGKEINLVTQGQATELDKSLIEQIIDPLTHLVRNSLDHGIEMPGARKAAGKNPVGKLTLSAQHSGGHIVIEVSDDGAGLDRNKILDKAIRQGFPVSEQTPDDELWQLIFSPGFSTAQQVTEISGRGVGMDVVRRNIQGLGGHIQLSSRAGNGTTTRIVLPLTLAILDGMSVQAGTEVFILPLAHVRESLQPSSDQLHQISDTEKVLHVRGEYLPFVALHELFHISGAQPDPTRAIAVILDVEEARFALLVDHLVGQQQVVVKNLETNYRKVPGISAATILGDGSVALIVDVFALLRMTRTPALTIA